MKTSESISELATALAIAQGLITDADKDRQGYGYKYADLSQILQILRPILSVQGLSIVQGTDMQEGKVGVTTRILHSSGQWIECGPLYMEVQPKKGLSQAQCVGSVVTYARRYALTAAVGITQDEDDAGGTHKTADEAHQHEGLTRAQVVQLTDLVRETDSDISKILAACGADRIEDISPDRYKWVMATLTKRKAEHENREQSNA